jgi:MobA/VirD2-like, nuclease domain
MIAKGNLHGDGAKLAVYLVTGKEGERAELIELRGFPTGNLRDAFVAAQLGAEARTHSTRPFFHAYVRLMEGESLDREQWQHVADRIEARLGFKDQPRALAFHHLADGATHLHMAWSRHDLEHDRALDPGLYKLKLKEISRQLERELGLTPVRNERDPDRKTLAPDRKEFEQSRRLGTDVTAIRENIRDCWDRSDNGASFIAALEEQGFILARGDRRDFVVIDPAGGDHALGKRILGVAAPGIRARIADIDKTQLPSVDEAKAIQAERARNTGREIAPQLAGVEIAVSTTLVEAAKLRTGPASMPAVDRGIPNYPAPGNNAPAVTPARPIVARGPEAAQQAERSAPARAGAREPNSAPSAPPLAKGLPRDAGRDVGLRRSGDMASRLGRGVERALAGLFNFLADMISPPKPPTKEEAKGMERAAEEEDRAAEFRRYVREFETRRDQIIEQQRAGQRREAEEQRERDESRRRRDDHGRER